MTKIISIPQLVYDNSTQRTALIIVEMEDWKEQRNDLMFANINYLAKDSESGAETLIKNKTITISVEKYNQMYLATDSVVNNLQGTPYEKRQLRKQLCLLLYVQNDFLEGTTKCIFNTNPADWVVNNG